MSGYPPPYGSNYNNYNPDNNFQGYPPAAPPSMNAFSNNQSCASLYGTPAPPMDNNYYPPASTPYDSYAGNSMGNAPYGMNASNNYPPNSYNPGSTQPPQYPPAPSQPYGGFSLIDLII